jgi:uncharacterized membrane protein
LKTRNGTTPASPGPGSSLGNSNSDGNDDGTASGNGKRPARRARDALAGATGHLATLALILYPVFVYAGLTMWGIGVTAPVLLAAFAVRLAVARRRRSSSSRSRRPTTPALFRATLAIAATGATLVTLSWILRRADLLLWYPVAVSLVLLTIFAWTLHRPPCIVARLARLTRPSRPDLPPEALAYTINVTRIWCVFFVFNATVATATCLRGDVRLWTLYNGAISYVLMGTLFAAEWHIRRRILQRRRGQPVAPPPPPPPRTPY